MTWRPACGAEGRASAAAPRQGQRGEWGEENWEEEGRRGAERLMEHLVACAKEFRLHFH